MKVRAVPRFFVHQTWPKAAPWLARAGEFSGESTVDDLRVLVFSGQQALFVVETDAGEVVGACTVSYFNRTRHRVAHINFMGGAGVTIPAVFDQLKALLRENGATSVECAARPSAARLYRRVGLNEKYTIVGADL